MFKEHLFNLYLEHLEKIFKSDNKEKIKKYWEQVKTKEEFLTYATKIINYNFKSKIIATKILKDKSMYKTKIYKDIVNKILKSKTLAREYIFKDLKKTFLMLVLENDELKLSKEQKLFIILEAEDSPFTKKNYDKYNTISIHGGGIFDIRYLIIKNKNFSYQEKKNLFHFFYPDDEMKINILKELEWEVLKLLKDSTFEDDDYNAIYSKEPNNLTKRLKEIKNEVELIKKINLCKYIKSIIPQSAIKKYVNND